MTFRKRQILMLNFSKRIPKEYAHNSCQLQYGIGTIVSQSLSQHAKGGGKMKALQET